jgi:type I restriction enzyme, S subunit
MGVKAGYKQTEAGLIPQDWDASRLSEIGQFKNGINKASEAFGHGSPFVNLMDVFGVNSISSNTTLGLVETNATEHATYDLKQGDVIFIRSSVKPAGVGLTAVLEADLPQTVYSGFLIRFRDAGTLDVGFKRHCFYSAEFRNRLIGASSVSANTNINQDNLGKLSLAVPPTIGEQRAIATALSDVDALLAKLDQLIAKKRDLKQAAMQQLLTGQTRLPGFSGEWVVKRLGEIGNCLRGVTYSGDADLFAFDTTRTKRLLRANNVQAAAVALSNLQFVNADRVATRQILGFNDVLICMANGSKALVGKAGLFQVNDGYEYTFGAFMGCFRTEIGHASAIFVFYLFQTGEYRNSINNLLAGSSINNLSPGSIESLEFAMPSLPEQTAIATLLSDIDADITALEARRDKTRALKQGMMQVLLTGQIRLV